MPVLMKPEVKLAELNLKGTLLSLEIRKALAAKKGREDLTKDLQDLVDNINQALGVFEDLKAENLVLTKRNYHLETKNLELAFEIVQIKLKYKIEKF